jgi:hypothetical protein
MKILDAFGQLLINVGGKLKRSHNETGTKATGQGFTTGKILIWGVVEGPIHVSEFDEDVYDYIDVRYLWMLICKVEEDGKLGLVNFWYQTEEEALAIKKYFSAHIEPLELTDD